MNTSNTPVKSTNIIKIDDFEDYSVLYNTLTAEAIALNPTGCFVWDRIDGKRTIRDISELLQAEFSVELKRAETDVAKLIGRLHRRMFVRFREINHFKPGSRE